MKILLSGVETKNKGAELMLYAILQEIERKYPKAIVYIPGDRLFHGIESISTILNFRKLPFQWIERIFRLKTLLRVLHIPFRFLPHNISVGRIDYYLDGSGFKYSDKLNVSLKYVKFLEEELCTYSEKKTKIVYLPQAFGPFEKENTREAINVLNRYCSILIPREKISYNYLKDSGLVDMGKVKVFTDFTSLVEGHFPPNYEHLKNGVCIIPNMRMIDHGTISFDDYIKLIIAFIKEGKSSGHPVYLLNHEGHKDEELCYRCQSAIAENVEVVTRLNALEVKGLIASAFLVVTSRFHGLASALNSCVPSLATSWSHKYDELYKDYKLAGYVLPINDIDASLHKFKSLIDNNENLRIRNHLLKQVPNIKAQTKEMWNLVWSI